MKNSISIIVPCYGVESYLNRCVNSLVKQSLTNIEIILVDDGSIDRVPEMCDIWAQKDNRIKVIHKKNAGLGYARNSGLEIAQGEYVAFIDSDDYVDILMFEKLYSYASNNNLDIVYSGFYTSKNGKIISGKSEVSSFLMYEGTDCEKGLLGMLNNLGDTSRIVKYEMSVWHAIYKRELLDKNKIRFCSEREFISEDIIFHIDVIKHCQRIGFIPDRLYYYCYNGDSLSKSYNQERFSRHLILFKEIERRILAKKYEFPISKISNFILLKLRYDFTIIGSYGFSFNDVKLHIRNLLEDERLMSLLDKLSYDDISVKYKFFFFLVRHKLLNIITLIIKK